MAGNDDELERRAVEELLKEASRGRVRAETMGPAGWMKCPLGSTNKRFLLNTLRPCAAEGRSGYQSGGRGAEDGRDVRDRRSRDKHHRHKDREYKRDFKHKRERSQSRSTSQLTSTGHAPNHSSQSKRNRSRSPRRNQPASKTSPDRTEK